MRDSTPIELTELEMQFGSAAPLASAILELIESEPSRAWQPEEMLGPLNCSIVDLLVGLARLSALDAVSHDGLGSGYQANATNRKRAV